MATRKKGGLGVAQLAPVKKDLLDSVFGDTDGKLGRDTPPAPAGKAKDGERERIAKYVKLDREVARQLKIFAATYETKEAQVIEDALQLFFSERKNLATSRETE